MEAQKETKLFAFKLAEKQAAEAAPATQWKVRDGVAAAGCCDPNDDGNLRMDSDYWGRDEGYYC